MDYFVWNVQCMWLYVKCSNIFHFPNYLYAKVFEDSEVH